jgi:hypothetical protein
LLLAITGVNNNSLKNGGSNDISDRLIYAAQVYQEQLSLENRPLLIVSTADNFTKDNNNQSSDFTTILSKVGVPPDRVILENNSLDLHSG